MPNMSCIGVRCSRCGKGPVIPAVIGRKECGPKWHDREGFLCFRCRKQYRKERVAAEMNKRKFVVRAG
jgi:hypothetical protein